MAVFQLGPIIKNRREELGLTQEELADGICSVPTLSRIENGERLPTKNHFEMLLQRLGYSEMFCDYFTDKQNFRMHELKIKIRQAYIARQYETADRLLSEFTNLLEEGTPIDKQFIILYQALLHKDSISIEERLKQFEHALQLTCVGYKCNRIPHVLSYEEIILLNNIAICYDELGDCNRAISILMTVKNHYNNCIISTEEALRTQPLILYNLSKCLGKNKRYDECIEICDLGIRIARESGRCPLLHKTLFNCAWAHLNRNEDGDKEMAKAYLKRAYDFANIMGKNNDAEIFRKFYSDTFAETL